MKVIVTYSDLSEAVLAVSAVIPARSTQPALANVLLTAENNQFTIVGTDKEQSLFITVPAQVLIPGAFAVPAKKLSDVLRQLKRGDVELVVDDFRLTVRQEGQWVRLPGMPADDFPRTELLVDPQRSFSLDAKMLSSMLDLCTYAMSTEITRINLAGIFWQIAPEGIRMVATDGHMLALVKKQFETDYPLPLEMIIPERAANRLLSLIAKMQNENVKITPGTGSIQFIAGNYRFESKLITEKYPDYERVLPSDNENIMLVEGSDLISRVQLMSVVSSPITNLVRFSLGNNTLDLTASDLDSGAEGNAPVSVDYEGEKMDLGFNAKMLMTILRHIPTQRVRFAFKNPNMASLITPVPQPEEYEYLTVLMPLRLPD